MKLLEVEEQQQVDRPRRPRGGNNDSIYKGVFFMNTFAVFAVVNSAIFKRVHKNYGFEVLDYFILRNVALFIVALTLVFFWKVDLQEFPEERSKSSWLKIMVMRSLFGQISFLFFNAGLIYAPVSLVYIIFNANPFMISLLGLILNGEPIQRFEIIGMILCFFGLILVSWSTVSKQSEGTSSSEKIIGILFASGSATLFSFSCVLSRKIKNVNFLINSTLHSIVGLIVSVALKLFLLVLLGKPFRLIEYPSDVLLKAFSGAFCDSLAVMSVIIAFMSDSSGFVSLFGYIQIVYGFFADVLVFKVKFTLLQLLSCCFILGVTITVAYIKLKRSQAEKEMAQVIASPGR